MEEEEYYSYPLSSSSKEGEGDQLQCCGRGHRSSFRLETTEGGSICLLCFSNLISNPTSPPLHVSYAVSQLAQAVRDTLFLHRLRSFHSHLLIPPLLHAAASAASSSAFHDECFAHQIVDLVLDLSRSSHAIACDFVARIADCLASAASSWSRRQIYLLHCFGLLLDRQSDGNPSTHIKDKCALISSLIKGLQLPSEEIRGEVLFVLFKLSILQDAGDDYFSCFCPKLVYLSLEALIKTQSDEVRMNCIALLTVLAQGGYFGFDGSFTDDLGSINSREEETCVLTAESMARTSLVTLFADAIKGSLLSSDTQVQISALDLIFHLLSMEAISAKQIQILVEESLADYVFEVLRLSENRDPLLVSCLRVLHLLATAEEAIRQSLAIGLPTLILVLRYVAEISQHPNQSHTLKLVWSCISHCPGIVSRPQVEELLLVLKGMFKRHTGGEMGMLPETFTTACSTVVILLSTPSSRGTQSLEESIQEVSRNVILSSFCVPQENPKQVLLYSLYLLKEAYTFAQEQNTNKNLENMVLPKCIIELCESHILPWIGWVTDEAHEEEEVILGVLETFHSILSQGPDVLAKKFAQILASSSWFSLSFGCLGLFPSNQMKWRIYLLLSSIVDRSLGNDFGQPIRDTASSLPSDPLDLLFLLGQKSSHDSDLFSCQSAVLLILYTSSLHDERLADEKQVLASLEQYILVNRTNFTSGIADSVTMTRLVHLYGLVRGAEKSCQTPYSVEAEKLLFQLIVEREWDLLSTRIHSIALKWLFQQEKISGPLSRQIVNYCRSKSKNKTEINEDQNNTQLIDTRVIAGLVAAGDNCAPSVLVALLKELQEEGQWDDIILVVDLMKVILDISPVAANQFCRYGISDAICSLYYSSHSLSTIFTTCSTLVFGILQSANSKMLLDQEAWRLITTKLLEIFIPLLAAEDTCNQEGLLLASILSLILYHSTNQTLTEASKAILLNTSLASAVNNIIQVACAKGPALVDHDEETSTGETLIFVLLLYFFSLRSMHAILEGTLAWEDFLNSSNSKATGPLSVICIPCHDLCRLIHFGSSPIKLVASQCLLELLTKISYQRKNKFDELNCSVRYLHSMVAVLQGLVFYGDSEIAMNCGLCLSTILEWEIPSVKEKRVIEEDRWFRLLMDELALSLAAPGLASKSFTNQHKPAARIAIPLLKFHRPHDWMRSVFDHPCISTIISNLSARNVSAEMVQLFRELVACEYLNEEQIMGLNHVFQACRKQVYMDSSHEQEEQFEKVVAVPDDLGKICNLLIRLMSSSAKPSNGYQSEDRRLLEAIEIFSRQYSTTT